MVTRVVLARVSGLSAWLIVMPHMTTDVLYEVLICLPGCFVDFEVHTRMCVCFCGHARVRLFPSQQNASIRNSTGAYFHLAVSSRSPF